MVNQQRGRESDVTAYNRRVWESPNYRNRIDFTKTYLRDQLFLTDNEIDNLDIDNRFKLVPFQLVVKLAVACMSYEFRAKYGQGYTDIDARKIAKDIEDLEYGRVPKDKMTPIQNEYVSMWAGKLKELFAEIEQNKTRLASQPQLEKKEPTIQDRMNELFRNG